MKDSAGWISTWITVDRKFDLLIKDAFQLRTEQSRADTRLEKLESRR
ncbi:MAG TPA: hypothetical protein VM866_06850 [Pyrinomonadaceae bacterium]|jgi:hypothetical protein|nr:hypothetical protein [Pyrinomonadaceae bacterium]